MENNAFHELYSALSEDNQEAVKRLLDGLGAEQLKKERRKPVSYTHLQVEELRELGCDYVQGFVVSKPLPVREYIAWIEGKGTWKQK